MKKICLILIVALLATCCFSGCVSDVPEDVSRDPVIEIDNNDIPSGDIQADTPPESSTDIDTPDETEPSVPETVCNHQFAAATCAAPKTCALCGKTEGNALEHTWKNATCTTPKTCSSCGKTEGSNAEHSWKAATCSSPKTCSVCGTTSGLTTGHTFSNGKCTFCGKADPNYRHVTMVWIPTKGGTKYHTHAGCSNMDNPEKVTQTEAETRGFTPCKRCH